MDIRDREIHRRAWLNFNCPQSNNWIVLYKFDEMVNHPQRQLYQNSLLVDAQATDEHFRWSSHDLSHVYFTYMTEDLLISLVETYNGQLILIHNAVKITETEIEAAEEASLPQIAAIDSKIYLLGCVSEITQHITGKERKLIALRNKDWLAGKVPIFKRV